MNFYSELQRQIERLPSRLSAMPGQQWLAWLNSNAPKLGIKKEEIEWSGIADFMALHARNRLTKNDLFDYVNDNGVRIDEVIKRASVTELEDKLLLRDVGVASEDEYHWLLSSPSGRTIAVAKGVAGSRDATLEYALDYGHRHFNFEIKQRNDDKVRDADTTKFSAYVLPRGSDYRELLLTLKKTGLQLDDERVAFERWLDKKYNATIADFGEEAQEYQDSLLRAFDVSGSNPGFRGTHWDEINVLAHVRFNERIGVDGDRVMFVEEIQSDWGQAAREHGVAEDVETVLSLPNGYRVIEEPMDFVRGNGLNKGEFVDATLYSVIAPDETIVQQNVNRQFAINKVVDGLNAAARDGQANRVPAAPFITSTEGWLSLVIKRLVSYAVESGYAKIGFINGEQSTDRFSLSKQVSEINAIRTEVGGYAIEIKGLDGKMVAEDLYRPAQLRDVVGKELAKTIIAQKEGSHRYTDLDLQVGGEGMRVFYDEIVPHVVGTVLKKLGSDGAKQISIGDIADGKFVLKNTDGELFASSLTGVRSFESRQAAQAVAKELERSGSPGYKTTPVLPKEGLQFGFEITPAMREKVLAGLPLFDMVNVAQAGLFWRLPDAMRRERLDALYALQAEALDLDHRNMQVADKIATILGEDGIPAPQTSAALVMAQLADAACRGEIGQETADFGVWLLSRNPALANNLSLRIDAPPSSTASGSYEPLHGIMHLFEGQANVGSAVHEILHHTERLMPAEIQSGINKGWLAAWKGAWERADAPARGALTDMAAAALGDQEAHLRVRDAFVAGILTYDAHYCLMNSSEYWAVNAAALLSKRYASQGSWTAKAKTWLFEMGEYAKGALGLPSQAPVLKALKAVISGTGKAAGKMLTSADAFADERKFPETVVVDGQARPTTNSLGQPIHPTTFGVINFWRWFGSSKAVDPLGQPLVVYHGTQDDIDVFDGREMAGWFSQNPCLANERYAGGGISREEGVGPNVVPAYVATINCLDLAGQFDMDDTMDCRSVFHIAGLSSHGVSDALAALDGVPAHEIVNTWEFMRAAKQEGFDSVRITEAGEMTFSAFHASQIKSAIGNSGAFDPQDPECSDTRGRKMLVDLEEMGKGDALVAIDPALLDEAVDVATGFVGHGCDQSAAHRLGYVLKWEQSADPAISYLAKVAVATTLCQVASLADTGSEVGRWVEANAVLFTRLAEHFTQADLVVDRFDARATEPGALRFA